MAQEAALEYINKVAPQHERTSCGSDETITSANARYAPDDFGGCYRCTLMAVMLHTQAKQ